jgi:hypothetical protein
MLSYLLLRVCCEITGSKRSNGIPVFSMKSRANILACSCVSKCFKYSRLRWVWSVRKTWCSRNEIVEEASMLVDTTEIFPSFCKIMTAL